MAHDFGVGLFKNGNMLCSGSQSYYEFCILEEDGTFAFGKEQAREGGVTLSSSWCDICDHDTLRPASAEEYRQAVKKKLAAIEQSDPCFYSYICSNMKASHRAFLSGAAFDYKYPSIIAEKEAQRKEQIEHDKLIELQNRSFYSTPVQAVYDFSTKKLKFTDK